MTNEKLQQANKVMSKIKELEEFKKALVQPYINTIRATAYNEKMEVTKTLTFESNSELYNLIMGYVENKLEMLHTEFNDL